MKYDNQKNDYILITAAVLLLILSAGIIFWFSGKRQDNSVSQLTPKIIGKATLVIDFSDGKKRNFEGDIVENETLLDVLILASKAGDFRYQLDKKMDLASIEAFTATDGKTWRWYINDKKVTTPLNEVILKVNDRILIKYE